MGDSLKVFYRMNRLFSECDNRDIQVESTTSSVYTRLVGKIALQNEWTSVMLITDEGNDFLYFCLNFIK